MEEPVYLQIKKMLEDGILSGKFPADGPVPSVASITGLMNVNHITAMKAINMLVAEKVLYKKRGIGMFVSKKAAQIIKVNRTNEFIKTTLKEVKAESQLLGIDLKKYL